MTATAAEAVSPALAVLVALVWGRWHQHWRWRWHQHGQHLCQHEVAPHLPSGCSNIAVAAGAGQLQPRSGVGWLAAAQSGSASRDEGPAAAP